MVKKEQKNTVKDSVLFDEQLQKFVRTIETKNDLVLDGVVIGYQIIYQTQWYTIEGYLKVRDFLQQQENQLLENINTVKERLSALPKTERDTEVKGYFQKVEKIQKIVARDGMREKIEAHKARQQGVTQIEQFKSNLGITRPQLRAVEKALTALPKAAEDVPLLTLE